jgi:pentatricopeptide repeat protein
MVDAYKVFEKMEIKGISANKYTYTILINENCNLGLWQEALRLYREMLDREIEPDSCTHSALLLKHLGKHYKSHAVKLLEYLISGSE